MCKVDQSRRYDFGGGGEPYSVFQGGGDRKDGAKDINDFMERKPALFDQLMPSIQEQTWYRQRFDACPHFMFFLGDAHISEIQHTQYPFGQRVAYAGFSKNRADWYHSLPELEYTARHIIDASQKNPLISTEMVAAFRPWADAFYAECEKVRKIDLSQLSDEELLGVYQSLADVYTKKLNASPLIDGFALSTDTVIASKVKAHMESKGLGDSFVSDFAVLTAPTFLSFLQEEEIALLKTVKCSDPEAAIADHQQKYFWIRNNYVKDHICDLAYFAERVRIMAGESAEEKIAAIEALPLVNAQKKSELMETMALPQEIRILLRITDDFNAWQDERKKGTFLATHYFSVLLEEFARRTEYTIDELKYAFPPEMSQILLGAIDRKELQDRFNYCMIVWVLDGYDVITDAKRIETLDAIGTGAAHVPEELKGFTAQLGKVQGRVKVLLSAEEIGKIEAGDILVSVMTRPDYLPAMKLAAAFVTDEGGITCHASIVARELGKPCIVGTKVATKVLKDGDMVEVDANTGVVRVLTRA